MPAGRGSVDPRADGRPYAVAAFARLRGKADHRHRRACRAGQLPERRRGGAVTELVDLRRDEQRGPVVLREEPEKLDLLTAETPPRVDQHDDSPERRSVA